MKGQQLSSFLAPHLSVTKTIGLVGFASRHYARLDRMYVHRGVSGCPLPKICAVSPTIVLSSAIADNDDVGNGWRRSDEVDSVVEQPEDRCSALYKYG